MPSPSSSLRRARPWLGTLVDIAIEGDASLLEGAMAAAFSAIEAVHALMSFHEAASDVSRINAAPVGVDITVDTHTANVLAAAQHFGDLSGGAFDVTTAACLVAEGFLPNSNNWPWPDRQVDYRDLLLNGRCVRWQRKGWVDLGGIAKGYAVDCAIEALKAAGVTSGLVNAGGDLRCFGQPRAIHVRHPDEPGSAVALGVARDVAVATSAGYFSQRESGHRTLEPLVDPLGRRCICWEGSVSVVAPACMTADALTKIVRLAPEWAAAILAEMGVQAIVLDGQGMHMAGVTLLQRESET